MKDIIQAIANTAQSCPDKCMVEVCNDNFQAHGIDLHAEWLEHGGGIVIIEPTECEDSTSIVTQTTEQKGAK